MVNTIQLMRVQIRTFTDSGVTWLMRKSKRLEIRQLAYEELYERRAIALQNLCAEKVEALFGCPPLL